MIIPTRYYDDGKQKHQSHEMHIEHTFDASMSYHGSLNITTYGDSKQDAANTLRDSLTHLINDAQETLAAMSEGEATLADVSAVAAIAVEFDATFYRKLKEAVVSREFRRKQRVDPAYRLKQLLAELKAKLLRAPSEHDDLELSTVTLNVPVDLSGHVTTFFIKHNLQFIEAAPTDAAELNAKVTYRVHLPEVPC